MEKRLLGKTDMHVSVLGFGGAEIGFDSTSVDTVRSMLHDALDAGLNVIDTAAAYLDSEKLIGEAVSGRRHEFYLFTKCGAYDGFTKSDWSIDGIVRHVESSLKHLKTDYLDLVQLHSCPIEYLRDGEALEALHVVREKGYARYVGYSGDGEPARYAIESGAIDTLQCSISIADQAALDGNLPLARSAGLGVIAKRPIANAAWRTGSKPENPYHHAYWDRLQKLDYDFLKADLKEAVAVALRFTLSQPGVHTAIVGTTRPGRWRENAALLEAGPLPQDAVERIRARWKEVGGDQWKAEV